MRILMLNSEFPPLGGGQGNANRYLLDALVGQKNLHVDLITASAGEAREESTALGKSIFLDIGKGGKNLLSQGMGNLMRYAWGAFSRARKETEKTPYDIVVAWSGVPAGFVALALKLVTKTPYIVLLRGADVPFYDRRWRWLDQLFFRFWSPMVWRWAKRVVANSEGLKKLALKTAKGQSIEVIPNGVDTRRFSPGRPEENQKFTVVFVGRLAKIKGLTHLVDAFFRLNSEKDCLLKLAGDGPMREDLEEMAKKAGQESFLIFSGRLPHDDLPDFYRCADIFVSPSFNEGMSNSLMEAMACGLPVVVTKVGGVDELFDGNGIVVQQGSADDILEALKILKEDAQTRYSMGKKSRTIIERFSWERGAEAFIKLLT